MKSQPESANLHAVEPGKLDSDDDIGTSRQPVRVEFMLGTRKTLLWLLLTIVVLLIAWSWFTELSEIAQAPGQLMPAEEVQPIRAPFDSKIEAVYVRAGDKVKKGDLLLKLDAKTYMIELEKYRNDLKIALEELNRHEHAYQILTDYMKDGRIPSTHLSGVTEVAQAIGELYAAKQKLSRAELDMKLSSPHGSSVPEFGALKSQHQSVTEQRKLKETALNERRQQFLLEEQTLIGKIDTLAHQVELQALAVQERRDSWEISRKQLAAYEKVLKSGASSQTEVLDARMRVEDRQKDLTMAEAKQRELEGLLVTSKHELVELQARNSMQVTQMQAGLGDISASTAQISTRMRGAQRALSEAQANYHVALRAVGATYTNEQTEIKNLRGQVEQLQASISSEERSFIKGELRSPVDGDIALVKFQGAGEVVQHGQDLLTLVPSHEKLVVCLYVPNEQVAFLHKGQAVKLQFPAYPYQQYGTITAVVTMINEFPSEDKEHASTYKVILEPQRNWIRCRGRKIALRQGLAVEAQLVLRKRRVLIGLLAPLLELQYAHFKA